MRRELRWNEVICVGSEREEEVERNGGDGKEGRRKVVKGGERW